MNPKPEPPHVSAAMSLQRRSVSATGDIHGTFVSDPIVHHIHTGLGMLFLFTLPLATAPKEIAFVALLVCTCVRLPKTWRSYGTFLKAPVLIALITWVLWHVISLMWSLDPVQGWDEIRAQRMLVLPLLLWPILDRIPWLIGAFLLGVLAQNGAQVLQGTELFSRRPEEGTGRLGGWINPIHTGAFCVAAMCFNLSAVLNSRGLIRWASLILLAIAAVALIATGSRGPWLSAAVALPVMVLYVLIRRPHLRRTALILAIAAPLAAAAAWPWAQHGITTRITAASKEAQDAREHGIYWTSVGCRIGMTRWATDMFKQHPLFGLGAGSYFTAQAANSDYQAGRARSRNEYERSYMTHAHPHSMYLYTLACTGAVGAAILLALIVLALRQCWIDPLNHIYADAMLAVLVSWLVGAFFDSYNLDGHRLGLFAVVIGLTLPGRQAIRYVLNARDETAREPVSVGVPNSAELARS